MANIVDIIVNATDNASREIDSVDRSLNKLGGSGLKVGAIMTGLVGSIAGVAPALAGVGALSSIFASASIGAGAFGAVAVSSISGVVEASGEIAKIEEQIANADSTEERIKLKKQLAQVMGELSSHEKEAVKDLQSFQGWWGKFTAQFQPQVFDLMGNGLDFVRNTMTALQPAIETTGNVLNEFMGRVNESFKTEQVQSFFDYINSTVGQNLSSILETAGNYFVGFMEILKAFAPLSEDFSAGMVNMSASFRSWAEGLSKSQGFQNFIEYVRANTPVVMGLIGNLFTFVGQLVAALAPLGSVVLNLANNFLQWATTSGVAQGALSLVQQAGQFLLDNLGAVQAILVGVLTRFLALKAISGIASTITTLVGVFRNLMSVLTMVRSAFMIFNSVILTSPITWIVAGIVALVAVGVLLYQNWDLISQKAGELWSTVKTAWNNMWTAIGQFCTDTVATLQGWWSGLTTGFMTMCTNIWATIQAWWTQLTTGFMNLMTSIGTAVMNGINNVVNFFIQLPTRIATAIGFLIGFVVGLFVQLMVSIGQAVLNGINNVITFFQQLPSRVMSLISTFATWLITTIINLMNTWVQLVSTGIKNIITFFQQLPGRVMSFITSLASRLVSNFNSMMSKARSFVSKGVQNIIKFFQQLPGRVISFITSLASRLVSNFTNMMSRAKSLVSTGITNIVNFFRQLPGKVLSFITSLAGKLVSNFTNMMGKAKSAVSKGVSNVVGAIKGFVGKFLSAGKGLLEAFTKGIKSGINAAKGAVEKGMGAIRKLLPFSPAKEGPLSDLDKSGESFFPTWYEAALKKVPKMSREIGGAMGKLNGELTKGNGSVELEAFSGGRARITIVHEHRGTVEVEGDNSSESVDFTANSIRSETEITAMNDLRRIVRSY